MSTNFNDTDRRDLGELLELVGSYDESEQEAFLLLGQVYKSAKRAGYKAGVRDARNQIAQSADNLTGGI